MYATGRRVRIPLVIFEIALGIVIGPDVLGWAHPDEVVDTLAVLGLSMPCGPNTHGTAKDAEAW